MKQAYTLVILLLLSYCGLCQTSDFTLTFEDTAVINQVYYTDSILDPAGIWQIGKPHKPFFDSAYASTNAVVTLLDSALPVGMRASFILDISSTQPPQGALFTFSHKFDFDSAKGGGYVEFSIDSGIHWHSVFKNGLFGAGHFHYQSQHYICLAESNDSPLYIDSQYIYPPTWWPYVPGDTTASGIPYFTGTDSVWRRDTIAFPTIIPYKTNQLFNMALRFTAFTDSGSIAKAGWIIDSIQFQDQVMRCFGGISDINSSHLTISPNPVESGFSISLTDEPSDGYVVTLLDLMGRKMMSEDFTGREVTLRRDGLTSGSYIVKVTNVRTQETFEKRVVFE